ncbi:MAG: response regulator [Pseudomonadota bacterium]
MGTRNVLIVDDDEAILYSTSFMLRNAGFSVKTYPDGPPFLDDLDADKEGTCVLLDVRMPKMDGLSVLREVRARGVHMPIIILTGHGDVSTAVSAMRAGATDFLEKPYKKEMLLSSIETAFELIEAGQMKISQHKAAEAKINGLTDRERQVLERLADGLTNKAIAEDLGISARTVEIHRANLMAKLEADTLSAALKLAFAAGLGVSDDR